MPHNNIVCYILILRSDVTYRQTVKSDRKMRHILVESYSN